MARQWLQRVPRPQRERAGQRLKRHYQANGSNAKPCQWLQCQANGSNVCRVGGYQVTRLALQGRVVVHRILEDQPLVRLPSGGGSALRHIYEALGQLGQDEPASG